MDFFNVSLDTVLTMYAINYARCEVLTATYGPEAVDMWEYKEARKVEDACKKEIIKRFRKK